jgi:hypothetical protein
MMFRDLLLGTSAKPEELQRLAAKRFPEEARGHGIRLWQPGDPYASVGRRYLLGVAAGYSLQDLQLMDELDLRLRDGWLGDAHLDVFDMSEMRAMEDFEKYIPGITPVYQSPILGIWKDGVLVERLRGSRARNRLLEVRPASRPQSLDGH